MAALLAAMLGFAIGHSASGLAVSEPPPEAPPLSFQSEADERRFLRAEIVELDWKWQASDWRSGESFAIEAELARLEQRLDELEQRLVETDPVMAIKEQTLAYASWYMQIPISEEEATQILGRPPTGSSLQSWLQSLEGTYYRHVLPSEDPSLVLAGVMQIWYRAGSIPLEYVVARQFPAQRYLSIHPHETEGITFRPYATSIRQLDDGTPVGFLFMNTDMVGKSFRPVWIDHIWHVEWISGGIRHEVVGVNTDAKDLLQVVEALSLRNIKR